MLSALDGVGEVRKAQVQQAGFVVLKSPDIPSMLVETAYISNPAEERRLRTPASRAALADAIATGVHSFFVLRSARTARASSRQRRNTARQCPRTSPRRHRCVPGRCALRA